MIKPKKSQIQIGETIAVLFIFFILITIGLIFYVKVLKGNIQSEAEESSQLKSVGIAQRVMFLPELQCSEDNVIRENCIDKLKLQSASELMTNKKSDYYDLFEFSNIVIKEINSEGNLIQIANIYSRTLNEDFKNKFVTNIPISLYNSITRRNTFGVLTIETYTK